VGEKRIKHVVVLMLENRSFDHMLGHLNQGFLGPLSPSDGVPANPANKRSAFVPVKWLNTYADVHVDPGHGYCDVMRQLTGEDRCNKTPGWSSPYRPTNDGFVWNYATQKDFNGKPPRNPREIMGCYKRSLLPVLGTLADRFAVCSRWHCSLPSETWPNRLFAHAGTSFGELGCDRLRHREPSIFDLVDAKGLKSRVYAGDIPQALTFVSNLGRWRRMSQFEDDLRKDDFPAYAFIEPRHFDTRFFGKANSQHPLSRHRILKWRILKWYLVSSGYVPLGEALIARVYTMMRSNPKIWNRSLLIVTYDEHGGFYDRLAPPQVHPLAPFAKNGFRFDLLGPRVPALVISPYVRPGIVEHKKLFDHTSIARTVRELFGISTPLSPREDAAETVTSLLELDEPRGDDDLPSLERYASDDWSRELQESLEEFVDRPLDDFQRQLLELAREIDRRTRNELVVTDETTSQGVEEQVVGFVQRNLPPAPQ